MTTWLETQGLKNHRYRISNITVFEKDGKLICPICFENKTNWNVHHCYFREHGGSDSKNNLLVLCVMCHTRLHKGEEIERQYCQERVFAYMASVYGGEFELLKKIPNTEFMRNTSSEEWKALGAYWFENGMAS